MDTLFDSDYERDKALQKKWIAGDQEAGNALLDAYYELAIQVCFKYTKDFATSQDLVQNTMMAIAKKVADEKLFRENFKGYLFMILKRRAIDVYRKKCRRNAIHEAHPEITEEKPDPAYGDAEELEGYVLSNLPDDQSNCLKLHLEGFDILEIAEKLSKSRGQVKGLLERARQKARKLIENLKRDK